MTSAADLRSIPSVDRVLSEVECGDLPRAAVVAVVRRELAAVRAQRSAADGDALSGARSNGDVIARIRAALHDLRRSRLQPVINATGIIIHTNFGRSPLGADVVRTLGELGSNYNNLEYDLAGGSRGGRAAYLEHNLALLCGAEAATVVNNCAAALVLILRHLAAKPPRTEVVISRGELIQIGGGFRIPEILEASGAMLREIGTTNKTTVDDYRRAIGERTAMVLKVHLSNFYVGGFTDSPPPEQIAAIAREAGATFDTSALGGPEREPTPADVLARGADLVTFSGDKLLGGPQAGIIAGNAPMVAALKREPFFRALRCDKLILGGLQTTVDLLLSGRDDALPTRAMMRASCEELRRRAETIAAALADVPVQATIGEAKAQVGGGSLPRTVIRSVTVDLQPPRGRSLEQLAALLRESSPPLIAYISDGRLKLDLRTIFPRQDQEVIRIIRTAIGQLSPVAGQGQP